MPPASSGSCCRRATGATTTTFRKWRARTSSSSGSSASRKPSPRRWNQSRWPTSRRQPRRDLRARRRNLRLLLVEERTPSASPCLDLVGLRQRLFKFVVEEPHGVENFAKRRRRLGLIGVAEGENA